MTDQSMQTKVTAPVICAGGPWYPDAPHGGFVSYRIWQQTDGRRWWQRHEWTRADGSIQMDGWIPGIVAWLPGSQTVVAQ